jgi:hypothetical protein
LRCGLEGSKDIIHYYYRSKRLIIVLGTKLLELSVIYKFPFDTQSAPVHGSIKWLKNSMWLVYCCRSRNTTIPKIQRVVKDEEKKKRERRKKRTRRVGRERKEEKKKEKQAIVIGNFPDFGPDQMGETCLLDSRWIQINRTGDS